MLSRENVTREVLSEMENQRARNLTEEKRRRDEAEKKSPVIAELLAQRQRLLFSGMRQAFASPASAAKISASMKTQMEQMNEKLRVELKNCGFAEDYLQPVYRCPLCKDTGYVGEPVHEQCACLKRAVLNRLYDNDGLQGLKTQNFETFREDIFPDVPLEGKKEPSARISARFARFASSMRMRLTRRREKGFCFTARPDWVRHFCSTASLSVCWSEAIRSS